MLLDLLTKKRIEIKVKASDWREVTNEAGNLLLQDNLIEPQYIQAMIDSIIDKGPYVVIAPGIALLHARPEDGVKELGMSLITLNSPVEFGHQTNDPVKVVFALGAVDQKKHIKAISQLVTILMKSNSINDMYQKSSVQELYQYLEKTIDENKEG
ncbi:hypothetical protein JCM16358_00900 [Halanaerocella petrolearia]